jgi:predicted nucleotidyltransferase/predicted transcriptional regulator
MQVSETQWKILKELAKSDMAPTDLAKTLKITLPSVHVQLKQLLSRQLIKEVERESGKTRPFTKYSLGNGFVYIIKALPGEISKTLLEIDDNIIFHLRVWSVAQKEYHPYLDQFWWILQNYIYDIDAVILFGSVAKGNAKPGSDIDILLLVRKDVEKYEKMFGAQLVGTKQEKKMFMCQVFKTDDFENSLKKGSDFAAEVVKSNIVLYDPDKLFLRLQ